MASLLAVLFAFLAGVLSFLSPCVLPLIPGYLSFMTGLSATEIAAGRDKRQVLVPALLFVVGFSLVFVSLGASASVIGRMLSEYRALIERIAGVAVIAFGLLMLGVVKVPWLYGEARLDMGRSKAFGRWSALVMGAAFAAGWTPCVGPILGTILTMAGSTGSVGRGALLLLFYSLGLGVPFVLVAVLFGRLTSALGWLNRHALTVNRVAGGLLVLVGALILTGRLGALAAWFVDYLPSIEIPLPGIV